MIIKMILYGIIIVVIFTFISFNPTPFIISFTGYYLMLHLTEVYIVRSFIKNNYKIVTTEKDYNRLNKLNSEGIDFLKIELKIVNENQLINFLKKKL